MQQAANSLPSSDSLSSESSSQGTNDSEEAIESCSSHSKPQKVTRFGNVEIRKYDRILGDNPACSDGCPVQLGWLYTSQEPVCLDEYEANRYPRRSRRQLQLTSITRRNSLHYHFGYTHQEIEQGSDAIKKIQKQRIMTRSITRKKEKTQEKLEKLTKGIKRTFSREKIYYKPEWDQYKIHPHQRSVIGSPNFAEGFIVVR